MQWLKLPHLARNDARLNSLTDAQHRVWFKLLLFASEQEERWNIEWDNNELLAIEVAQGDIDLLLSTIERLQTLRIVTLRDAERCERVASARSVTECDASAREMEPSARHEPIRLLSFPSWDKKTATPSSTSSAERSRRYREAKKLRSDAPDERDEASRHAPSRVTRRARSVTKSARAQELELDREKEILPSFTSQECPEPSRDQVVAEKDDVTTTREVEPSVGTGAQEASGRPGPRKPRFPEDGGRPRPGPHSMPLDAARRIFDDLWDCYENAKLCTGFLLRRNEIPLEAWEWAKLRVFENWSVTDEKPETINFLLKFAQDWKPGMTPEGVAPKPPKAPLPSLEFDRPPSEWDLKDLARRKKAAAERAAQQKREDDAFRERVRNRIPGQDPEIDEMIEYSRRITRGEALMPLVKSPHALDQPQSRAG